MSQKVNLYDFDGTIYKGHSSIDFFMFTLCKYPRIIKYAPRNIVDLYRIKYHLLNLQYSRVNYCKFLQDITDIDLLIEEFWNFNKKNIKNWYIDVHDCSDIVVTASPRFLVEPICDELGIRNLVASEINKITGEVDGCFCFNGQKIEKFRQMFPDVEVDSCYTDNVVHDAPLLSLAKNIYRVKGNKVTKI